METETRRTLRQSARWSVALGVLMMILGIIAIAIPLYASMAVGLFFGWLFILCISHDRR